MRGKRSLFLLIFLGFAQHAISAELFQVIDGRADLTQAQADQLDIIEGLSTTADVQVVRVDPQTLNGSEEVTVAVSADTLLNFAPPAQARSVDTAQPANFDWNAVADVNPQGDVGTATMTVTDGQISGSIRTATQVIRFQALPGGLSAMVTVNLDQMPPEHPEGANEAIGEAYDINEADLRPEGDTAVADIRILVVATPSAASEIGNLNSFANLSAAVSNDSFRNSNIAAHFTIAGTAIAQGYDEAGNHSLDLDRLTRKNDGYMDDIHGLRDTLKADVVVLLTVDGSYCGLARQIYASASSAFATVFWQCAVDNLSFPHEVGHLMGACHNPEASNGCSSFVYGQGFINPPKKVRTVMAYPCPGVSCVRMPQWARPPEWGNASPSNDARVLQQTAPRVALFRN